MAMSNYYVNVKVNKGAEGSKYGRLYKIIQGETFSDLINKLPDVNAEDVERVNIALN